MRTATGTILAHTILLATGVENHRPSMSDDEHSVALRNGLLRYCPICDGYEVTDKVVGVVGSGGRLLGEAKFLRSFSPDVTVFSENGSVDLSMEQRAELVSIGVRIIDDPVVRYWLPGRGIELLLGDDPLVFDTMYAALGSTVRSGIVASTGVDRTEEGCLFVDDHQRTSVPGLYAAGDVVVGVDQIAHAIGQASVAATAIRNDLCVQRGGLLRSSSTKPLLLPPANPRPREPAARHTVEPAQGGQTP